MPNIFLFKEGFLLFNVEVKSQLLEKH